MAHHAAEGIALLKQGHFHPGAAKEICCRHSRRTAADNGCFPALCDLRRLKLLHERVVSVLRRDQLHGTDMDRLLIEVSRTFAHTYMRADRSCDKRKRALLCDHIERFLVSSLIHKLQIRRDVLMDRAPFFTGRSEAV